MRVSNEAAWKEWVELNDDDYGSRCVRCAQRWAELMEENLDAGQTVEQCANATFLEANTEGITAAMYRYVVSMLAQCWEHGDQLRRWHNLKYQIGDEGERANESGGVLNPAVFACVP